MGFGIMGGANQPLAHAQFVSNIVDYGMNFSRRWRRRGSSRAGQPDAMSRSNRACRKRPLRKLAEWAI